MDDRCGFYGVWVLGSVVACFLFSSIWPIVAVVLCVGGLEMVIERYRR